MKQLKDDTVAYGISVQRAFPAATRKRHSPTLVSNLGHHHFKILTKHGPTMQRMRRRSCKMWTRLSEASSPKMQARSVHWQFVVGAEFGKGASDMVNTKAGATPNLGTKLMRKVIWKTLPPLATRVKSIRIDGLRHVSKRHSDHFVKQGPVMPPQPRGSPGSRDIMFYFSVQTTIAPVGNTGWPIDRRQHSLYGMCFHI